MKRRVKKIIRIVVFSHVLLAIGLLLTHCSFTRYANKAYAEAKREKPYDVIIVPGVPYEQQNTTSVMKMRIFWAKHLYDSGYTRNIIFSGSAVYTPFVESVIMKVISDSLGIPPGQTFSETKAEHSTENIYYSWKLAKRMGFQKIALATDPYQSRMLRSFIREYCPEVKAIPIVFDLLDMDGTALPSIDTTLAYVPNFVSLTEREGFWQRLKGTMGKRIKDEVRLDEYARRENTTGN
ncbi:MAG: YdcF family protein [Cyclobacteriaceae bacterium]|jgi:vancomycin permeability regulator SanA|nr:YdcF family protein [Cyclobacteriaceae bacterium]MDH4298858.1 YdcF family protein [Cyclobacteriaceae bacterium]MDH5250431.1 YdcF family protein [Cyclobacteriaceae bacterium]